MNILSFNAQLTPARDDDSCGTKMPKNTIHDKNERECQAYYEMLFHEQYPQVSELSQFYKHFFANKALEYYKRIVEGTLLEI